MTDHTKALADALEQVLSQLQDYQRGPIAENAEDALAAYRAAPQSPAQGTGDAKPAN